ncbi:MAG: T9SS type A sorting domain-containing protein [Saprospiraceae bacterium]|nr:T9SS type A sorting domain-containing protein [Saprospiraceae bacterium]
MRRNSLTCASNVAPTYTLTVQVSGYSGNSSNFRLQIIPEKSKRNLKLLTSGGNGTYTFTQQDLNGYDPNPEGMRVLVYEQGGNGGSNVVLNVSLSIQYGGGSSTTTLSASYSNCLFGTPVSFKCTSSNLENSLESRSNNMEQKTGIIAVYPSPATNDFINLRYESLQPSKLTVEVFDINGKIISQKIHNVAQGENILTIELANTTSGIHLLKVKQDNLTQYARFSIIK